MTWRKLGQLYSPRPLHPKLLTHAANPVPIPLGGSRYRILFSGRDKSNRSSVGWVEVDIATFTELNACTEPLFTHGAAGTFYADGVSIGNPYRTPGGIFLPFMGWQAPPNDHWRGDIGRLRIHGDGSLIPDPEGAWLARSDVDPISLSYPWVMRAPDGTYRMWYGSTHSWDAGNGEMLHVLHGARSIDGHTWQLEGPCVPFAIGEAQAFSRPTVIRRDDGSYRMWYSCRSGLGEPYRIGSAVSQDLDHWDFVTPGIDVSRQGWDEQMIEYPFVWHHEGRMLMLYNGNDYGATGFGLAEWVDT